MSATWDVVVIGGGPAGSAAATMLARQGHRVLILEKTTFPRYSVGESMVPYCYFPLERLGLLERMREASFLKKYSVQFVRADGRVSQPFYFDRHLDHPAAQTWQVSRAEFDQMLLDHARGAGAIVREGVAATGLLENEDGAITGVEARDMDGQTETIAARLTIDASGRSALAASRLRWRVMDTSLKKIAVWTYFRGAKRDAGRDEGATTVAYVNETDWFWYIPLQDDLVSVGVVGERETLYGKQRDPQAVFDRAAEGNPWIADRLSCGVQIDDMRVTGDFSYRSQYCAKDGLLLVGDAFAFLDPVFSTGLLLALYSGVLGGEAAVEGLEAGDVRAERFSEYAERLCTGIESMRRLVYTFYDPSFSFGGFLKKHPGLRGDLTDCLIGHLERNYDRLFEAMAEFAEIPPPLPHGRPMITSNSP